jgi:hypothetical protein
MAPCVQAATITCLSFCSELQHGAQRTPPLLPPPPLIHKSIAVTTLLTCSRGSHRVL